MKKTITLIIIIALLLLGTSLVLKNVTRENMQKEHIWLLETLLPGGTDFVKVHYEEEDTLIRSVHKSSAGYVIETATQGYADEITMLIGVNNDGYVTGLVTLKAYETLSLGSNILTDHKFLSQFLNKSGSFSIGTDGADAFSGATADQTTSGNEIYVDGISGATVSSKAVAKCVNAAIAYATGADAVSSATNWEG